MAKMTYNERINEKLNQGISHLQAEIEVTQEDYDAKITALRRRQETEETRIREIMINVLWEDHRGLFDQVEAKARRRFEDAVEQRRARANGTTNSEPRHHENSEEPEGPDDAGQY
ncbi:hypothetical protein [Nesterenkonia sp. CF4.4]|uniref:hypothetical protein n=1 Tax=Nesterenkonia sp. CF4.4 TaxID=3373079 RepID=UPI003EE8188C